MNEETRKAILNEPVPWDDVRRRRVYARIQSSLSETRKQKHRILIAAISFTALSTAVVIAVLSQLVSPATSCITGLPFTLPDAGTAFLHGDATVTVNSSTENCEIEQSEGTVTYEIQKQSHRKVVVIASHLRIEVVGTRFTVRRGEDRVRVSVLEGIVAVYDDDGLSRLEAGDSVVSLARGRNIEHLTVPSSTEREEGTGTDRKRASPGAKPDNPSRTISSSLPSTRSDPSSLEQEGEAPIASPSGAHETNVDDLFTRIDQARRRGDLNEAIHLLNLACTRLEGDPKAETALFTLGKVYRARGNHGQAAQSFRKCWDDSSDGPLAEDARAEEAMSWDKANEHEKSAACAREYLEAYPNGIYAGKMESLLE